MLVEEEYSENIGAPSPVRQNAISILMRESLRAYLASTSEDEGRELGLRYLDLTNCLEYLYQFHATEPRDMIYGLHALCTSLGMQLAEVDYEKPIIRVYEEAAAAMIWWSGRLHILNAACLVRTDASFPSWVPNWSDVSLRLYVPGGNATAGSLIRIPSSGALNPIPGELHVRGKLVGVVEAWPKHYGTTPIFPAHVQQCGILAFSGEANDIIGFEDRLRLYIEQTRFFRQLYMMLQTHPMYGNDLGRETFAYHLLKQNSRCKPDGTFATWLDILQYPNSKFDPSFGENRVKKWKPPVGSESELWTEETTNCAVIFGSLMNHDERAFDDCLNTHELSKLSSHFSMTLAGKTLIMARLHANDRMVLGTSVSSTRPGDCIVLLQGSWVPVVLRRTGSRWSFISLAFVAEIMDGEAWLGEGEGLENLRDFVLV
jgi:hypothetical protein